MLQLDLRLALLILLLNPLYIYIYIYIWLEATCWLMHFAQNAVFADWYRIWWLSLSLQLVVELPLLVLDSRSDLYHCLSLWFTSITIILFLKIVSSCFEILQVITGYLLAGSVIGPGGLSFVSEMVQVCRFLVLLELTVISSSSSFFFFCFFFFFCYRNEFQMEFQYESCCNIIVSRHPPVLHS